MSSSIPSWSLIIFLIPSFLVLFSAARASATASSSSALIKKVCKTEGHVNIESKFCIQLLESQPIIVSATNMLDLSTGIIKSGISRATYMHEYVVEKLQKKRLHSKDPKLQGALKGCESSYGSVMLSFKSAQAEVDAKQFEMASYDLSLAPGDQMMECLDAVASNVINDKTISTGNLILRTFAFSADQAVSSLDTSK